MDNAEKTIFGYWHQGRDAAPDEVKLCWALWADMNPAWNVAILEWDDVASWFEAEGVDAAKMSFNGVANLVRLRLLMERGGVWVDAYTVPLAPLDTWLPDKLDAGFFAFHDPYRKRLSENWFIASRAGHPLITAWYRAMAAYWRTPRRPMRYRRELDRGIKGDLARLRGRLADRISAKPSARGRKKIFEPRDPVWAVSDTGGAGWGIYPYFALAYLFDREVYGDPVLFEAWRQYPKITSYDCLLLRHWKKDYDRLTPLDIRKMGAGKTMQKLNLKVKLPPDLMDELVAMSREAMPR